jgi:hypothetical protein
MQRYPSRLQDFYSDFKESLTSLSSDKQTRMQGAEGAVVPSSEATSGACCRHVVNKTKAEFAFGMCQECYISYIQVSGGIVREAADPPAYTRNLRR